MKETYRFVGAESTVGDVQLKRFGQKIELTEEEAHNAILGGAAVIPDAEFEALGFTDQELAKFPHVGQQVLAPVAFKDKKHKAHDMFRSALHRLGQVALQALEVAATVAAESAVNAGANAIENRLEGI